MVFSIPAKTFLVGEYLAMLGGPALLLTTTPHFECSVTQDTANTSVSNLASVFHTNSPAGQFIQNVWIPSLGEAYWQVKWHDPYRGLGGFGASSAQFLGVYFSFLQHTQGRVDAQVLLNTYLDFASDASKSHGPSGYDVMAQAARGCVFIEHNSTTYTHFDWGFESLGFILIHTGKKLATHTHLQSINSDINLIEHQARLLKIVGQAKKAFEGFDEDLLIESVHDYHKALGAMNLVAPYTENLIIQLQQNYKGILAAKGCGALGADVILILTPQNQQVFLKTQLRADGFNVISTSNQLFMPKKASEFSIIP